MEYFCKFDPDSHHATGIYIFWKLQKIYPKNILQGNFSMEILETENVPLFHIFKKIQITIARWLPGTKLKRFLHYQL